jgi:hypothetical protein
MNRTKIIRDTLGLSQVEMGARLRVSQQVICRLEGGQVESGPVSLLLDQLEAQLIHEGRLPSQFSHYPDTPRVADDTPERLEASGTLAAERERTSPVVLPSSSAAFCDTGAAVAYAGGCDGGSC